MKAIESFVSRLTVGEPQVAEKLAVFPLFLAGQVAMDYLLLDEALQAEQAHVTEVSEGGHVPELAFENASPRRVLLVDGDELVGARQNRIVNITILVGAGKKLVIPVSCVEQGRWSYRSRKFEAAERSLFASLKARKMAAVSRSLREDGMRESDQGEVWDGIRAKMSSFEVSSDTAAMGDLYAGVQGKLDDYEKAFAAVDGQVGAVFATGSRVIGLEVFDAPEAFAKTFRKMVRAYAMDAQGEAQPVDKAATLADVRQFLEAMTKAATESYAALGEGEDVRLEGENLAGGALVDGERVVHLAAYRLEEG